MSNLLPLENDDIDHAFLAERNQQSEFAYEEKIAKQILSALGIAHSFPSIRNELKAEGIEYLTLPYLYSYLPKFPIYLSTRRIPYVHQIAFVDLISSFTRTPIYKAFADFLISLPEDVVASYYGMIFNWPGIGTCVLHNMLSSYSKVFFVRTINDKPYIIEPWSSFSDRLRAEYKCDVPTD